MRQGLERLRANKLALAACIGVVVALTGLGVWTNITSERQGDIEEVVRVQHTEVVQALCNRPYTRPCLRRAMNIVRTCIANRRCADLLSVEVMPSSPSAVNRHEDVGKNKNMVPTETPNSSQQNGETAAGPRSLAPSSGDGGDNGDDKDGDAPDNEDGRSPPPPEPEAEPPSPLPQPAPSMMPPPAGPPPPGPAGGSAPSGLPLGPPPPEVLPEPPPPSSDRPGLLPALAGVTKCALRLDLRCAVGEIVRGGASSD